MPWFGWLALGVSVGLVAGMVLMGLLVAAGREPTEAWVDHVDDRVDAWRRVDRT